MPYAYISAGSTTRVKDGPGLFKGAWITPVAGSSLVIADNPILGNGGPDFNNLGAITSTLGIHGVFVTATNPMQLSGFATRFQNALTVSASSSARVSVFFE